MRTFIIAFVLVLGAFLAAALYAQTATPTPGPCHATGDTTLYHVMQVDNLTCRAKAIGPTAKRCMLYAINSTLVLDCGGSLLKVTTTTYP